MLFLLDLPHYYWYITEIVGDVNLAEWFHGLHQSPYFIFPSIGIVIPIDEYF